MPRKQRWPNVQTKRLQGPGLVNRLVKVGLAILAAPLAAVAQVSYVARFTLERQTYLVGEPVFCAFTIHNTGSEVFSFSYRTPSRLLNLELKSEPRFTVQDDAGHPVNDPAPRPCGGAKGSAVYGSVRLPPGQTHTERWLLNQWARFSRPGRYRVRAERRLPLLALDSTRQRFAERPAAYALAINELTLELATTTDAELEARLEPYLKILDKPGAPAFAEVALAVTTLPQPFMLDRLVRLASAPAEERQWDRTQALEGLARLGTPPAWEAILKIALGEGRSTSIPAAAGQDDPLRADAVLLLGEKGEEAVVAPLLGLLPKAPENLRGEILRALGLFHHPRANQVLFEKLHSPVVNDRVNAILGLRNLESNDVVPALIAMLRDPNTEVRQVANFALQRLTGEKSGLSPRATPAESNRVAGEWHAWWREHGGSFVPLHQPPCQDW